MIMIVNIINSKEGSIIINSSDIEDKFFILYIFFFN